MTDPVEGKHNSRKENKCELCDKAFSLKTHLVVHIQQVHDIQKIYECGNCKESFLSSNDLKIHVSMNHANQYQCDICDKTCSAQQYLRNHMKIHDKKDVHQ